MPAAFPAAGCLPAAGFGAHFKPSHLIRGRRALSPSSPSALEFVMATPESPRPPIVMSRLDSDRIEAPIEIATDRGVYTTPAQAEINHPDDVGPATTPSYLTHRNPAQTYPPEYHTQVRPPQP